jgi:hypothetical protein
MPGDRYPVEQALVSVRIADGCGGDVGRTAAYANFRVTVALLRLASIKVTTRILSVIEWLNVRSRHVD